MAGRSPIKIEVKGLKEMQAAFKKSPDIVKKVMIPALKKSLIAAEGKAIPYIPVDQNFLRGSNKVSVNGLEGELENTAPYAMPVHEGSKPHFPPYQKGTALEQWANRRGIPPFLVAKAISQKGTKGTYFYDKGLKDAQTIIDSVFEKALDEITNQLSK